MRCPARSDRPGPNLLLDAMDDIRLAEGSPREVGIFTRAPKSLKLRFSPAA
jgi:hypothetical protein